jgi:hypothetical protein
MDPSKMYSFDKAHDTYEPETKVKTTGYCKLPVRKMSTEAGISFHDILSLVEKVNVLLSKLVNYLPEGG